MGKTVRAQRLSATFPGMQKQNRWKKWGWIVFIILFCPFRPADGPINFEDTALQHSLTFILAHSPTPSKFLVETMGGGCAFLDFNNDGILDVYLVNGAEIRSSEKTFVKTEPKYWNRLFRGTSSGAFIDVTEKAGVKGRGYGMGVAVADYNNDGLSDLFVTNFGFNELYRNRGDGTFSEVAAHTGVAGGGWSTSAAFLDFDRDGDLDLYVTRYVDWSYEKNPFCGPPGRREYCAPSAFAGVPDLLFRNNADGTFSDVSHAAGIDRHRGKGLGVAVEDYDGDGWLDVYVANDGVPCFLFRNQEGKGFEEEGLLSGAALSQHGMPFAGMGVDAGDVDHDGWPEIFVTALSLEGHVFFKNNGDGTFADLSTSKGILKPTYRLTGWGTKLVDLDNDGDRDILVVNGHFNDNVEQMIRMLGTVSYPQPLLLLRNIGSSFSDVSTSAGHVFEKNWVSRGAAFGDYNNDGLIDALVTHLGGRPLLLENRTNGNLHNWIGFDLRGTVSNRDALGARVRLTDSSGRSHYYRVNTTGSYLSASDKRIIIGLGQYEPIRGTIAWPSGQIQQVHDLTMGIIHRIAEPQLGASQSN